MLVENWLVREDSRTSLIPVHTNIPASGTGWHHVRVCALHVDASVVHVEAQFCSAQHQYEAMAVTSEAGVPRKRRRERVW